LGEHTTEISATLDEEIGCADVENLWYWRKPAKVLRDIIIENRFESIGGNLQINLCFNNRFDSYALFTQTEAQQVGIKFRNIDFTEDLMGNVGECNISLGAYMVERPH
jgi:hypothetical protein